MMPVSHIFSSLGLRAGFGYTGGVNRSVYPVLIMDYSTAFRSADDDYYRMGYVSGAPNPNLRWEKNRTINAGLNFGFLDDRITGEVAWYNNKNLDQVTKVRVPNTTGFSEQAYNTSEQLNTGVEITLGATVLKVKDFSWRIMANAAYNYNELTKYEAPVKSLTSEMYVGYPLGKIFTGKFAGVNPETGVYDFTLRPDITIRTVEDYRQYQNYLFYVGTSNAPWTGGFSTSFSYKNLSLNIVGNFSLGGRVVNDIVSEASYGEVSKKTNEPIQTSKNDLYVNHLNVVRDVTYRWTEDNPITDGYPRLIDAYGPRLTDSSGNLLNKMRVYSDTISKSVLLENVSYLKLSSISLTYAFPEKWMKAIKLGGMSASFLMNNLFTITNYSGIDPETPGAVYPQSRSFTFSLSLSF
jgi:hypothetical protein